MMVFWLLLGEIVHLVRLGKYNSNFCLVPSYPFTKAALLDEVDSTEQSIDLQEILNEVDRLGWCE